MELKLKRIARKINYTIGRLYIDGKYFCDTIEDTDRGLTSSMSVEVIRAKKVASKTAIPAGRYQITYTVSNAFKGREWAKELNGKLPLLNNVPGYEGIRIHPGTDESSTSGCLIVGENKIVGKVINSQKTYKKLNDILYPAYQLGVKITIEIS